LSLTLRQRLEAAAGIVPAPKPTPAPKPPLCRWGRVVKTGRCARCSRVACKHPKTPDIVTRETCWHHCKYWEAAQ